MQNNCCCFSSRFFRAVSYRQFTHLVHGFLGKSKRIAIPACASNAICSRFKTIDEDEFAGFYDEGEDEEENVDNDN